MATIAALAGAAMGAYSSNRQAKAAKDAAKASGKPTTTTTTSSPWLMDYGMKDKAQYILDQQQAIYDNVAAGSPMNNPAPAAPKAGKNAAANQSAWDAYVAGGKQGDWNAFKTSYKPAAGAAAPTGTAKPKPASPTDIMGQVADKALNYAANDPSLALGQKYSDSVLSGDDFSGHNALAQDLYGRLGNASLDQSTDLLMKFLGGNYGGGGGSGNGGGMGGKNVRYGYQAGTGGAPAQSSAQGAMVPVTAPDGSTVMVPAHIAQAQALYGGGEMPDTVGGKDTFFAKQMQALFDPARLNPADDPTLKPYIDAMKLDAQDTFNQHRSQLAAQAEGRGRFGGGLYQSMANAQAQGDQRAMDAELAKVYMGSRQDVLNRQMQGLGLTNARDMALLGDNTARWGTMIGDATNRYGIDAQERASNAASSAGAGAAADQLALARRGQDLEAIMGVMKNNQFGLGTIGDLGKQLDAKQTSIYGGLTGLSGVGLDALNTANNAGSAMGQYDIGRRNASNAGAGVRLQNQMFAYQQQQDAANAQQNSLNNYLRTLGAVGGMGGTQTQVGTGQPMQAPNVGAATAMGAMGGAMAGYGMFANTGGAGGGASYLGAGQQSYIPQGNTYQAPTYMPSNMGYQPSSFTIS